MADQVALGRSMATKQPLLKLADLFRSPEPRSSINRIWGEDRQTIGLWSNGYVKVPVEHVVWLSPSLVSRWLGFLSAREYWSDGELESRWTPHGFATASSRTLRSLFPSLDICCMGWSTIMHPLSGRRHGIH